VGGASFASDADFADIFFRARTFLLEGFFAAGFFTRAWAPFTLSVWTSLDFFGTD
jgi:hypothetical protein